MAKYRFHSSCKSLPATDLWKLLQKGLSNEVTIKSVSTAKAYTVNFITDDGINLQSVSRNQGEPESIFFQDFEKILEGLKVLENFNTSTVQVFKNTRLYKKRSLIFALLKSSGIIVPV